MSENLFQKNQTIVPTAILLSVIVITSGISFDMVSKVGEKVDIHKELPAHPVQTEVNIAIEKKLDALICIQLAENSNKDAISCLK